MRLNTNPTRPAIERNYLVLLIVIYLMMHSTHLLMNISASEFKKKIMKINMGSLMGIDFQSNAHRSSTYTTGLFCTSFSCCDSKYILW